MGLETRSLALIAALTLAGCTSHSLPDACYEKPSSGRCQDSVTRFYHDPDWGECRAFIWGGCDGNAPFETMEDCTRTCDSPAGDLWTRQQNETSGDAAGP